MRLIRHGLPFVVLSLLTLGCSGDAGSDAAAPQPLATTTETAPSDPATPQVEEGPLLLFLGDSLTAGFGLSEEEAYPALVRTLLAERGIETRIVNAGVSGDTTAGGLARLDWLLRQQPDLVVVALGANDGLRGFNPAVTEDNLRNILQRCREAGTQVLLAGIVMPPNYGVEYQQRFAAVFPRLAEEFNVALLPFLLEGVGGEPSLNLPDGIHPNAEGQQIVAATVADHLEPLLR